MLLWTVGCTYLFELVLWIYTRSRTGGNYSHPIFCFFEEHSYCFPQWLHKFTSPPTVYKGPLLSTSSPTFVICGLFDDGHSDRWCFPGGSVVKHLPANAGDAGSILDLRGSPRRKWQPTPVFLLGKSPGQRSQLGYSSWGHKKSDTTELLNNNNADWCSMVSHCGFDFTFL